MTDTPASTEARAAEVLAYALEGWITPESCLYAAQHLSKAGLLRSPAPTPEPRTVTVDADDLREAAAVLSAIPALHGLRDRLLAALDRTEGEQR